MELPCVNKVVVSCRVVSCRVVSCRMVSYRIVSYRVVSYRVVWCRILSCLIVSYLIVSYRIYRIVSYRIVSCRNLPHLARFVAEFILSICVAFMVTGTTSFLHALISIPVRISWTHTSRHAFHSAYCQVFIFTGFWASWCTLTVNHVGWALFFCVQETNKLI